MRNLIILGIIFLALWVLYSLNVQYGWVELQLEWTKVAIGIAAAGGPLQYLKQKMGEKTIAKQELDNEVKFRTMNQSEFLERERKAQNLTSVDKKSTDITANNDEDDFLINEPSFG